MADDIAALVQALPQELYDEILDLTLTVKPQKISVDQRYKLPIGLHINSHIRKQTARSFYGSDDFKFITFAPRGGAKRIREWLQAIDPQHRAMIKSLTFLYSRHDATYKSDETLCSALASVREFWLERMRENVDGYVGMGDQFVLRVGWVEDGDRGEDVDFELVYTIMLKARGKNISMIDDEPLI